MCIPAPTHVHAQHSESRASLARNHSHNTIHTPCTHTTARRLGGIYNSIETGESAGPALWRHLRAVLGGCMWTPILRISGAFAPRSVHTRVARLTPPPPRTRVAYQPMMVVQPVLSCRQHHTSSCTVMHTPLSHTPPRACSPAARHTTRTHAHASHIQLHTSKQDLSGLRW